MKIIGLTGGIGSGKTTVAKLFEELGVPVYNSDLKAKKLMQKGVPLTQIAHDLFCTGPGRHHFFASLLAKRSGRQ